MNKRGEAGDDPLTNNAVYLVLFIIFFSLAVLFVYGQRDGVGLLEDFYAKEIVRVINSAESGDEVILDVSKGVRVASKNGRGHEDIFDFDNENNRIIVKLSSSGGKAFGFFNDVEVLDSRVELVSGGAETSRLFFRVAESKKGESE